LTIELKPEQEQILQQALQEGRFASLEQALDEALLSISSKQTPSLTPSEMAAAFRSWAASHSHATPPISDEAISREAIYSTRG
jgi:hypothetical protein